jgi:hypothetical protein
MSAIWIEDLGTPTSLSYVGSASSTGATITIPATSQAGDIAVLYDVALTSGSTPPTLVTPAGWANRVDEASAVTRLAVCTKLLDGSDPGAVITGMNGVDSNDKLMVVFRPDAPINNLAASSFTHELNNADASPQTISASGAAAPVLVIGGCGATGGLPVVFSTASPAFDATVTSSSGRQTIGYKIYNEGSPPANHTIDIVDLGSRNTLWGAFLAVS